MRISHFYSLGLCFFTLSWLLPNHYRPWVSFHLELLALVGLVFLLTGLLLNKSPSFFLSDRCIWLALTVAIPWLQFATGINFFAGDALLSSLYLSGFLAAVFVGYHFVSSDGTQEEPEFLGLMHSLWVAAMASAAIGIAQWFNVDELLGLYRVQSDLGDRAMGNLGQANQLATLLLMGMSSFAYIFERKSIGQLGFLVGIFFLTLALILTQSRAGMLSVVVLCGFLSWKKQRCMLTISKLMIAAWVAFFLLGTLLLPVFSDALLLTGVRNVTAIESVSQRWQMWQQIAYAVTQSPWLGYGWNQTPAASAVGALVFQSSTPYDYAHNFVLDMLAWNGLPLGILLTGAIAYWFISRILATNKLEAIYAMACLLPIAVHSMFEYPFAYSYFLISAGFMIGTVEAVHPTNVRIYIRKSWIWLFWMGWVSVGSYLTVEYFLIEEDFRVVRFENLRVGQTEANYKIPNVWMISHLAAMLKARRVSIEPNMQLADLENLHQVSQRFADNVLRFRYALALALNNDPIGSKQQLDLIRGVFGDSYYRACIVELRRLHSEKYPELAVVLD